MILFLIHSIFIVAKAQTTAVSQGIIITQRDTIPVYFKLPLTTSNDLSFVDLQFAVRVYKSPTDTLSAILTANQALQIEFDFKGKHVLMASTNNYVGFTKGFTKPDLLFLKVERQGRATLCSYFDPNRSLSGKTTAPKQYYILYQRNKTYAQIGPSEAYIGVTEFFKDCKRLKNLKEEAVTFENLPNWVEEYNNGNCDD